MRSLQGRSNLQAALEFVMLKTQLQRLGVIGGGYGFLACAYGLPRNHHNLYMVHVLIGAVLIAAGILSFARPRPCHLVVLGALLVAMGGWINVMAKLGEAAGGSPGVFAVWGIALAFVGALGIYDHRRFAHLSAHPISSAEISRAGTLVKKLLSANAKKQPDVILVHIGPDPDELQSLPMPTRHTAEQNAGSYKARLLPDAVVLLKHRGLRAFALRRSDFGSYGTCAEMPTVNECAYSVCIFGLTYVARVEQRYARRLTAWLTADALTASSTGDSPFDLPGLNSKDGEDKP